MAVTIGFVVNPVAGMGGRVALKGTDGAALAQAIERGAAPRAPGRAGEFAGAAAKLGLRAQWLTAGGPMGAAVLSAARLEAESVAAGEDAVTSAADTQRACREFMARGAKLIVFVGGDGTARDIFQVVGTEIPILGVPSGVKMHSGVFALTPAAAAEIVREFVEGRAQVVEGDVVDEDEEAMRQGRIEVELRGVAKTLDVGGLLQASKEEYGGEVEEVSKKGIADTILERMENDTLYLIGPGTTSGAVMDGMGLPHTILGVDIVMGRKLVKADATEAEIRAAILKHGGPAEIIASVIGHQGFVFGRGNLQFSPEVIRSVGKKRITIVAAERKVEALQELLVDTGEPALDAELAGHWRVLCGYRWNVLLLMRAVPAPQ